MTTPPAYPSATMLANVGGGLWRAVTWQWAGLNALQGLLVSLGLIFVVLLLAAPLLPRRRRGAMTYLRYLVLGLAATVVLAPFVWLVAAAFKKPDFLNEYLFLPPTNRWGTDLGLDNFAKLFEPHQTVRGTVVFWQYLINSLFLASATTVIQLFFSSLGGYALAKYEFRGKKWIMGFMLGSMMIPGMILLAPVYELIVKIGWVDTYLALIVPGAVSVFGMFLFRQAMLGVPDDLIEAGRIDGCSEFAIYLKLVMPLVRPMAAAFCLVCFLGSWNSFIAPNVYIHAQHKLTLPVVLNQYVQMYSQQYGVFLAGTLLAIIPPAILFFALQREFVAGLTSGAVKG